MNWTERLKGVYWKSSDGFYVEERRGRYVLLNGLYQELGCYMSLEKAKEAAESHIQVEHVEREVRQ